jgi:uncharacterized protein
VRFIKSLSIMFLVSLLGMSVTSAYAASFDCAKAATETEKVICNDPELSALDDMMSELWFANDRETAEKQRQSNWLAERNACQADRWCIEFAYGSHLEMLRSTKNISCFEHPSLDSFVENQFVYGDLNNDGLEDRASFDMSTYGNNHKIKVNIFMEPGSCVPTYTWWDVIETTPTECHADKCAVAQISLNEENNLVISVLYYLRQMNSFPDSTGTYTVSMKGAAPTIVGYTEHASNMQSGPDWFFSVDFLTNTLNNTLSSDGASGWEVLREQIISHDFDKYELQNGDQLRLPKVFYELKDVLVKDFLVKD